MLEASDTGPVSNGGGSDIGHGGDVIADSMLKRDTSLTEADENDNKTNKRIKSSPPETTTETESMDSDSGIASIPEGKPIQKLDVPSAQLKFIQKQVLIEKLMSSGGEDESMEVESESGQNGLLGDSNNIVLPKSKLAKQSKGEAKQQQRKTFKIRSSVLNRVKSFLPEFRTANEELLRLPDPSKLSLESESDEMDGRASEPGTSGSTSGNKTFVEMNLALVEQSDSDSSTDEESYVMQRQIKGLPPTAEKCSSTSPSKSVGEEPNLVVASKGTEEQTDVEAAPAAKPKTESVKEEKKALITELN